MNAAAPAGWRLEVTEDMRKGKITEMYIELLRLSGENDRQKVWQSAAKFELTLWTQSVDKATYWTKLEKKVAALKKKPQPGTVAPPLPAAPQQVSSAPSIPHQQQQHQQAPSIQTQAQYSSQMGANSMQFNQAMLMQQAEMLKKQQEQHQLAALNHARQQQAQAQAQAQAAAQAKAAADKQQLQEQQRLHALNLARQQQLATARAAAAAAPAPVPTPPMAGHTQVLHQLQQQFQQQKQAVLTTQHNELQRLRQAQLLEQNHLANLHSTQDTPPDLRRLQLTQLQQQHLVAQNKLSHEHKAKTDELMRRHQQILTSKLTPAGGAAVQVPAAHADAAAAAQARARALSRLQATSQQQQQGPPPAAAATTTAIPSSTAPSPDAYGEKLKQVKAKYWNDLEIAQREFTRIAAQKPPAGAAAQQTIQNQERVKVFLQNLKRIMTLLAQDPTKATTNNVDMLIKVEQHIERQVIPALLRVKSDKSKKE
ncbi:hypothetical protein DYB26_007721, partial [Aphanomyces astaci]